MQKWKSHEVVEAAKILSAVANPSQPGAIFHLQGEKDAVALTPEWLQKHQPGAGIQSFTDGYYVRYAGGVQGWSPADAFEEGYTRLTEVSDADLQALTGEHILQFFAYEHLPPHLQEVSRPFAEMAAKIMERPRNPERTVALRKLLEAKDAAVRAELAGPSAFQHAPQVGRSSASEPNIGGSER